MDIQEQAQEILLKLIETNKTGFDAEGIAAYAWEIVDAMQAEADKRKEKGVPEAIQNATTSYDIPPIGFTYKFDKFPNVAQEQEWQPDWSVAPDDATAYEYLGYGGARWHTTKNDFFKEAPVFDLPYYGSVVFRKRP